MLFRKKIKVLILHLVKRKMNSIISRVMIIYIGKEHDFQDNEKNDRIFFFKVLSQSETNRWQGKKRNIEWAK